jgi:hypothetical protein
MGLDVGYEFGFSPWSWDHVASKPWWGRTTTV